MATEHRPHPAPATDESPSPSDAPSPSKPPLSERRRGGTKLRLPRRRPLRPALETAFARSLAVARRAARKEAPDDPVAGVHEYRKALRRARALVSLLTPSLGKTATKRLTERLRRAFAATSAFRDADILQQTLASVPGVPEEDLARHTLQVALELEQRRTRRETSEALEQGLAEISALAAALQVLLDPDFSAQDLEDGIRRSRRRERVSLERAVETTDAADFHEWRKRVKELRYQIELLASTGSRELKKREKALGRLAQDLGEVTDLTVLAREIEKRSADGSVPPAAHLVDRIRKIAQEKSRRLLADGVALFEPDPRQFARQVMAERG